MSYNSFTITLLYGPGIDATNLPKTLPFTVNRRGPRSERVEQLLNKRLNTTDWRWTGKNEITIYSLGESKNVI